MAAVRLLHEYTICKQPLLFIKQKYMTPFQESISKIAKNSRINMQPDEIVKVFYEFYDTIDLYQDFVEMLLQNGISQVDNLPVIQDKIITHDAFILLIRKYLLVDTENICCKLVEMKPMTPKNWLKTELAFDKKLTEELYGNSHTIKIRIKKEVIFRTGRDVNFPVTPRPLEVADLVHIFKFYGLIKDIRFVSSSSASFDQEAILEYVHKESCQLVSYLKKFHGPYDNRLTVSIVAINDFENKESSWNDDLSEQICILPMKFRNANLTEIYFSFTDFEVLNKITSYTNPSENANIEFDKNDEISVVNFLQNLV
jgi:hypothetical protein